MKITKKIKEIKNSVWQFFGPLITETQKERIVVKVKDRNYLDLNIFFTRLFWFFVGASVFGLYMVYIDNVIFDFRPGGGYSIAESGCFLGNHSIGFYIDTSGWLVVLTQTLGLGCLLFLGAWLIVRSTKRQFLGTGLFLPAAILMLVGGMYAIGLGEVWFEYLFPVIPVVQFPTVVQFPKEVFDYQMLLPTDYQNDNFITEPWNTIILVLPTAYVLLLGIVFAVADLFLKKNLLTTISIFFLSLSYWLGVGFLQAEISFSNDIEFLSGLLFTIIDIEFLSGLIFTIIYALLLLISRIILAEKRKVASFLSGLISYTLLFWMLFLTIVLYSLGINFSDYNLFNGSLLFLLFISILVGLFIFLPFFIAQRKSLAPFLSAVFSSISFAANVIFLLITTRFTFYIISLLSLDWISARRSELYVEFVLTVFYCLAYLGLVVYYYWLFKKYFVKKDNKLDSKTTTNFVADSILPESRNRVS